MSYTATFPTPPGRQQGPATLVIAGKVGNVICDFEAAFHANRELLIAWSTAFGWDIAFTDGDLNDDGYKFSWFILEPGAKPPPGRPWRVHHCGHR